MKSEIDKKRRLFRESIRKNHLQSKFKQIRLLMKDIVHEDIRQQIHNHLATLREYYTRKEDAFELLECLTELRKISQEYKVMGLLCHLAHNEEFTWLEMLCLMMKEQWSESLRQQCSSLLSNCVEQLKYIVEASKCDQIYVEQLKSIMQKYPYLQIKEGTPKTIQNSLKIVYFISLSGNNSTNLYYLLNKTNPSLLKMLHILNNNKQMMSIERVRESYIITCVSLAFLVHTHHLETHQSEYYQKLKHNLSVLVEDRLHKSNSKEEFSTHCEHLRIMTRIEMYVPSLEQFQRLEEYLIRQLHEENQVYFKMMQTITYITMEKLSAESARRVIECIFEVDSYADFARVNFRLSLLKLMKDHINNCSNRIRDEDALSFIDLWGSNNNNASHLIELAVAINLHRPSELFLLFEIVGFILTWAEEPMDLIETKFYPLLKYPHYRMRLQQQGYQLQEDEL